MKPLFETDDITSFTCDFGWLSNFYPVTVELDGIRYSSVEHAYQAAKFDRKHRHNFGPYLTPGQAKRLARSMIKQFQDDPDSHLTPDWDFIKYEIMVDLIRQKFSPNTDLAEKLVDTGNRKIVEGNTWGDTYWGVCDGKGLNVLGNIIMAERRYLQSLYR
jgi:ribA/ribD-fused uncharacterized protein